MSRSSAEAEYRLMATLTVELKWSCVVLLDLAVAVLCPLSFNYDSQSALHISHSPIL